ncbi:hypothetical protein BDB01DRAFT_850007 [Pilobolus umbonatus]|nr:hypothetical protein BDB01DRAFT_850007 [Pilobolus umbonatus]
MTDLNWCTSCDNAVNPYSESLYCSEQCLREDALRNHPLLGYTYPEFTDFPRPKQTPPTSYSACSSVPHSPALTATSSQTGSMPHTPPKFDLMMGWFSDNKVNDTPEHTYQHAPKEQDEDQPMELGELMDIFSFEFIKGRPLFNFFLAILWCLGLPILLYELLKPFVGQVLAMIIASAPPLAIAVIRMVKEGAFDPLGFVAGISFLVSGILSIAEPDEKIGAICESLVMLFVGIFCLLSLLPIKIGSFELKPLVFQFANQVMPRPEQSEEVQKQDDKRLTADQPSSGTQRLDYLYTHMAKFRHDMRVMTVVWGVLLIVAFIVKVIVVMTDKDMTLIQIAGFVIIGLTTLFIMAFTWFYTTIVRGHVIDQVQFWKEEKEHEMDKKAETAHNIDWCAQTLNNSFNQLVM